MDSHPIGAVQVQHIRSRVQAESVGQPERCKDIANLPITHFYGKPTFRPSGCSGVWPPAA